MNHEATDNDTKARLLDAAEILFGQEGFEAISVRTLTDLAYVNLGAVTYHFGSKEALYKSASLRRFREINIRRIAMLEEVESRMVEQLPTLEEVLNCLLRPPIEASKEHPEFFRLMARNLITPPAFMDQVLPEEMQSTIMRFSKVVQRILPDLSIEQIRARSLFCGGALLATIGLPNSPIRNSAREAEAEEIEAIVQEIVGFCAKGYTAPAALTLPKRRAES